MEAVRRAAGTAGDEMEDAKDNLCKSVQGRMGRQGRDSCSCNYDHKRRRIGNRTRPGDTLVTRVTGGGGIAERGLGLAGWPG